MKLEVWKDIEGYPNYQVSNLGNVKSKERYTKAKDNQVIHRKEKLLKQLVDTKGYHYVRLYNEKSFKNIKIHRLVANAFVEKVKDKDCINHIDGNKSNNQSNNLEWCTQKENINYAQRVNSSFNDRNKKVEQYDKENNLINTYESISEASRKTGITITSISYSANGKRKTGGGFIWRFV